MSEGGGRDKLQNKITEEISVDIDTTLQSILQCNLNNLFNQSREIFYACIILMSLLSGVSLIRRPFNDPIDIFQTEDF